MFVQNVFDPTRSTDILGDELVNAEKPRDYEQASEGVESEPVESSSVSIRRLMYENHAVVDSVSARISQPRRSQKRGNKLHNISQPTTQQSITSTPKKKR